MKINSLKFSNFYVEFLFSIKFIEFIESAFLFLFYMRLDKEHRCN